LFRFILHSALQGKSAKILSKLFSLYIRESLVASCFITFVFFTHCLSSVNLSLSILIALLSFAVISQVLFNRLAIWLVLLHGAAVTSKTISFGFISKNDAGI
jgi:hypothetical protein